MAIRRPHRSIETFDISLMAVVTKAMGAFLVLMLLLVPSYIGMPELQQATEEAGARNRDLEQEVATLSKRNEDMQRQDAAEIARTNERVRQLENDNKRLQAGGGAPALIMTVSAADCEPSGIELYIHGENVPLQDGGTWPAVQLGPQPMPSDVLYMQEEGGRTHISNWALGLLGLWLGHEPHSDMVRRVRERSRSIVLLAINHVAVGSRYGVYVKSRNLRSTCRVAGLALSMADTEVVANRFGRVLEVSNKVYFVGRYVVTQNGLNPVNWTPEEQAALDRRLGTQ